MSKFDDDNYAKYLADQILLEASEDQAFKLVNEGKVMNVTHKDKSLKDLMGYQYPSNPNHIRPLRYPEPDIFENHTKKTLGWRRLHLTDWYCHLRVCSRKKQIYYQTDAFTLEDLFRLYKYNGTNPSTVASIPIEDYNKDANLWVFYACSKVAGDKERYLFIQAPNRYGAIKVVIKNLSPTKGLELKPYERNTAGYNYIMRYHEELKEITTIHYETFKRYLSENELNRYFSLAGDRRTEVDPKFTDFDYPYELLTEMDISDKVSQDEVILY